MDFVDLECVLATVVSPRQPTEGELLNALGFQPSASWNAQLSVACFQSEVLVLRLLFDGNLETDPQAFTRIK